MSQNHSAVAAGLRALYEQLGSLPDGLIMGDHPIFGQLLKAIDSLNPPAGESPAKRLERMLWECIDFAAAHPAECRATDPRAFSCLSVYSTDRPKDEKLASLERVYTELADFRNSWPGRNTSAGQAELVRLRDAICEATGRSPQDVQDDYGTRLARGAQR